MKAFIITILLVLIAGDTSTASGVTSIIAETSSLMSQGFAVPSILTIGLVMLYKKYIDTTKELSAAFNNHIKIVTAREEQLIVQNKEIVNKFIDIIANTNRELGTMSGILSKMSKDR